MSNYKKSNNNKQSTYKYNPDDYRRSSEFIPKNKVPEVL